MKRLFRRADTERDVGDELRFHLEMRTREFIEQGLSPEEARRAAAHAFGDLGAIDAELRAARGAHVRSRERRERWREWAGDVLFAARTLRKNGGFTAAALATLALGGGAATAVFTVVNGVLLRPLPYADPSRLAMIWLSSPQPGLGSELPLSGGFYNDAATAGAKSFSSIAAFRSWPYTITGGGEPEQISGARVSPSLETVLGVRPLLGHWFADADADSAAAPVAVISHALWQRRFGGDPSVVNRSIELGGLRFRILGVMPRGFAFPRGAELPHGLQFGLRTEIWTPLPFSAKDRANYGGLNIAGVARLRPGATLGEANGQLSSALKLFLAKNAPKLILDYRLVRLDEQAGQNVKRGLYLLLGAVAFLLVIACANVANLLVARTGARRREFAVRAALGAGRGRIARQLMTENFVLAALGSVFGGCVSLVATRAMLALVPGSMPRADDVQADWRVALSAGLIAIAVGAALGLAAGSQVRWSRLADTLREAGTRTASGRARAIGRRSLVVAEVSLSLMLVIGAGLLTMSFVRLQSVDPGFAPAGTLTASVSLPVSATFDAGKNGSGWARFFRQLSDALAKVPGVEGAGAVSNLPLSDAAESGGFAIVGQPAPEAGRAPQTEYFVVEGDYFRAMGIKLVTGRLLDNRDVQRSARVAVVNREFVKQYLGAAALDRQIIPYFDFSPGPRTIVGVVDDVHYGSLDARPKPQVYVPEQQMAYPGLNIVLRTHGDPMALLPVLKRELRAIDGNVAISRPRPMNDVVAESLARRRFSMTLIGIFAGSALALAIVGLYGVIALSVSQRRRELGVRLALGAQAGDVMRLVLGEGLRITAIGVVVGLGGAFALSRLVTSLLYDISATSASIYAFATAVVVAVTLFATLIPAKRATEVDPNLALRSE